MLPRRLALTGLIVALPGFAHAACDTSRWRKILNAMVPDAHACGTPTITATGTIGQMAIGIGGIGKTA